MQLNRKIALVTGAAKRVGRQIALDLASKGARILLHYNHSKPEALQTAEEIRKYGVDCKIYKADLSKSAEIASMTADIYKENPSVDVLVNSASVFQKTPFLEAREADWDAALETNLKGPFLLSRTIGARMFEKGGGKIVNIADWSGFKPYRDYAPYCASKGGLITLTKSIARDLAPKVLANAVAPGPVMQPESLSEAEKEAVAKKTVLGRWGSPSDVSQAVIFLLENDFINGTVLVVDGGRSML